MQNGKSLSESLSWLLASTLVVGLLSIANIATAGQGQPASIIGTVTDESGGALPGVTVTATSPALQVREVTAVTDETGEYRLTPLPIGTYSVTYSLQGFQTFKRDGLRLTQAFVATVDASLKIGGIEETITVSGASPVVDVTSTAGATVLTQEILDLTPTSRNGLITLMAETPGTRGNLDVGGSAFIAIPSISAFGQVAESWPVVDGVNTVQFRTGQNGNYFDYNSFEEARTETYSHGAELPKIGVAMAMVVRSGSNTFHGQGDVNYTDDKFQNNNVDAALKAVGIPAPANLHQRRDGGLSVGGRLIRDKLWFFSAIRERNNYAEVLNSFQPDGSPVVLGQVQTFKTVKVNYQMTQKMQLSGYIQYATKDVYNEQTSAFADWSVRRRQDHHAYPSNLHWQWVPSNNLMADVTYGWFSVRSIFAGACQDDETAACKAGLMQPSLDSGTSATFGENLSGATKSQNWNYSTNARVSWYKPGLFKGDHQFNMGLDFISAADLQGNTGEPYNLFQRVFNRGVPFQLNTFQTPNEPLTLVHYFGPYFKDAWKVASRLTLNLGVRYAHDNAFVPATCKEAGMFTDAICYPKIGMKIWNPISPRLHAAWDLQGNGMTVLKGGYGRFAHVRDQGTELSNINPNNNATTTWVWHDLNGDKYYQPGEVNLAPNGPDFVSKGIAATGVPNPDEKEPMIDEYSLSLERQLRPNLALRVTGLKTHTSNTYRTLNVPRPYSSYNIPIVKPDPGPDGVLNTADDTGTNITYYAYPASLAGAAFSQTMLINDPNADQNYKSVELAMQKRLDRRWQMSAAYTATKKHVPFGNAAIAYNPNAEINIADDNWEWEGKISGAYLWRYGVTSSVNYQYISGTPYARTVSFTTGGTSTVPSLVANVTPVGEYRLPTIKLLDLRLEKAFRIRSGHTAAVRFNIYNAVNANTATAVQVRSGAAFNQPTTILPARLFEIGAQYSF